jgi:hypothetical protein
MKCCFVEGGVVFYNRYVCICVQLSSLRGSELVIGTVWGEECGARDGPVWRLCRCGVGGV